MPRPEYRNPKKKTIYAEVEADVKELLLDICYRLDMSAQDALPVIIRYYVEKKKIGPRPRRKK